MNVTAVVQRSDFEAALSAASEVGRTEDVSGLASPLGADLLGRVDEAWDTIESALGRAYEYGKEATVKALSTATSRVEELITAAGAQAKKLQEALVARLHRYISDLISRALERIQTTIQVAEQTLPLVSVEVSQAISLTGSLKVNLTDIVNMTAEGQLIVNARYGT